jgi:hypothetical protein
MSSMRGAQGGTHVRGDAVRMNHLGIPGAHPFAVRLLALGRLVKNTRGRELPAFFDPLRCASHRNQRILARAWRL